MQRLKNIVEQMLGMLEPEHYHILTKDRFAVEVGNATITFDASAAAIETSLEQLATAIEAAVAHTRVQAMLAAVEAVAKPLPLWLITGSSVLASWLDWSGTTAAFRKRLSLCDHTDAGPIIGSFDRRTRRSLGQTAAKIRVRNSLAIAERVELPGSVRCIATLGQQARFRIEGMQLPETLVTSMGQSRSASRVRFVAEVCEHPFFSANGLKLAGCHNDRNAVIIEAENHWRPLRPIPGAARAAIPNDADETYPWRATDREIAELYQLVDHGRANIEISRLDRCTI
jgi:hypothetical protein